MARTSSSGVLALERILQSQGFGSRKTCRQIIRAGRVAIEGNVVDDPFSEIPLEGLVFQVDEAAWKYRPWAYVMLHKPVGYECSRSPKHHPSVLSLLPEPLIQRGVQPVGRLDEDTTGLLLLSDDGEFIHRLISPKYKVPKVYAVRTKHPVEVGLSDRLVSGVQLHDEPMPVSAMACEQVGDREILLTLSEGRYHQVKRMVAAAGNRVESLCRSAIGALELPQDMAPGAWRWLSDDEVKGLIAP